MATAEAVGSALKTFEWDRLGPVRQAMTGEGERATRAAGIMTRLRDALVADELTVPIASALRQVDREIFEFLAVPPPITPPPPPPPANRMTRPANASNDALLAEVHAFLESHADRDVDVSWQVRE